MADEVAQAELWAGYRDAIASLSSATRALMDVHQQMALRAATKEHMYRDQAEV